MNHLSASDQRSSSRTVWLPSLLLLAQLLTIIPVLFVVFSGDQQRGVWDSDTTLLDKLDGLASSMTDLEHAAPGEQPYSQYRAELQRILSDRAAAPIRGTLVLVDSMLARSDVSAAQAELSHAERSIQSELRQNTNRTDQITSYLKALVAGVCVFGFGVVLVIRRFRRDAAIQRKLQQELRTTNEEVVAALTAARAESAAKNKLLEHLGSWIGTPSNVAYESHDSEALARIMSQVVDYSKLESGTLNLESIEFEPAKIVSEALELYARIAGRKDVRVTSDVGGGLSGVVKGDPRRLGEVLVNVVGAAVAVAGKTELVLSAGETIADGRTNLRFELRLKGKSISEELRQRILEPFAELPEPNAHTGLGLAISKKLAELMGGKLDVTNQPRSGCTFWFTAVFETVSPPPEPRSQAQPGRALSGGKSSQAKGGRERRAEPRHGINYPTLLRSEHAGIASVRILDVSTSGLRVSTPFRLDVLSEVEIRVEGLSLTGTVRNCTCIRANEFHAGIEIRASSSSEHYLHHLRLLRAEGPQ